MIHVFASATVFFRTKTMHSLIQFSISKALACHEMNPKFTSTRIGDVMVSVLSVDRGFEPRSGQTKVITICTSCKSLLFNR